MSSAHRAFKDSIYEQLARLGKCLSSPKRLELLDLLSQGPRTVESVASEAGVTLANASQHLRVLHGARVVETRRLGLHVEYRIANEQVGALLLAIRQLAESRVAEVRRIREDYFAARDSLESVTVDELLGRVARGEVTLVDVRPPNEHRAAHVAGAVSIPITELEDRIDELPRDGAIVAYCRGPYCVMALDAVEILRAAGFSAHRLELGIADFRSRGITLAGALGGRPA